MLNGLNPGFIGLTWISDSGQETRNQYLQGLKTSKSAGTHGGVNQGNSWIELKENCKVICNGQECHCFLDVCQDECHQIGLTGGGNSEHPEGVIVAGIKLNLA